MKKKEYKKTLLPENSTIRDVINSLDKSALQVVLVTKPNKQLIGTITDGDIRRQLIVGLDINTKIKDIMNTKFISVKEQTSQYKILKLFDKKINQIYKSFERIRNKEFERIEVDKSLLREINPLKGINEEIYNFANLKQF